MKTLNAAVIGTGYLGHFHAQKYKKLSEEKFNGSLKLAWVCDALPVAAQKVAESLGVGFKNTHRELFGLVDLVTIATNSPTHFAIAKDCLNAGIHVNVEKPMCMESKDAQELVKLAQSKGLLLTVGHSERFAPAFDLWRKNKSTFESIEFERHAPYNKRGMDVSVIHDLMVHDIDLALSLFPGELPQVISASAGSVFSATADWATCLLQWSSGKTAWISSSRAAPQMLRRARALGTQGLYSVDFQNGIFEHAQLIGGEWKAHTENVGRADNLLLETECFVGAVLGKNKLEVSSDDGARVLQIVDQILARIAST